jgi:hypothetical protein
MDTPHLFVAVTKEEFKATYFRHAKPAEGWTEAYWQRFYEAGEDPFARYLIQEPASPEESRMRIVNDYARRECRMFFVTEDQEERLFDQPGA